jgi:CRP-like cAMP-binding protein
MTTSMTNELFANLSDEVQRELTEEAKSDNASRGSRLIQNGVASGRLIFLNSGSAEITVPVEGKPVSLGTVGPGKVLGLRSIMCGEVPEIDVTCLEECKITLLSKEAFLQILQRNPQMYFAVVKVLTADLKTVQSFLREKTGQTKATRVRTRTPIS